MKKEERHLWYDFLREYPEKFTRQKVLGKYITDIEACGDKCTVKSNAAYTLEINGLEYAVVEGINEFIVC